MTNRTKIVIGAIFIMAIIVMSVLAVRPLERQAIIITTQTEEICFVAEIADTWFSRAMGLMFRFALSDHHAMLFRYDSETPVTYRMKLVPISLDIIFISDNGRIANIHENAVPYDPTPIRSHVPVSYVLEIEGGASRRAQITAGDQFMLVMDDQVRTRPCLLHQ